MLCSYHSTPWEQQLLFPCHHTDSVAATLQFLPNQSPPWQYLSLVLRSGGSWGWGLSRPACCCVWWSAVLVQWLKVLPLPVECSAGRVGWGASQKREREGKGAENIEKEGRRGGLTFEQCRQEAMTQFSVVAVKQSKCMETLEGWKMKTEAEGQEILVLRHGSQR